MKMPAEVIRQLLIDLGQGTDQGEEWPVFVSFLPDSPANAICLYDTAGRQDGRLMRTGLMIEHPGVQVRVRGPVYSDVWLKIRSIVEDLDAQANVYVTVETDVYSLQNISRSGNIIPLGMEDTGSRRDFHFTANLLLTLSLSSAEDLWASFYDVDGKEFYAVGGLPFHVK